ncbi:MAG TPA: hypothetical protein VFY87_28645 [Geminicoccaceae bacterium]|nr:hypothetical protein [Geminicoccaceae bacterium]
MNGKQTLGQHWETFRPTKAALVWSCVACTVGATVLGFTWGGWVTGGTARSMAEDAAAGARSELAAAVCVDRFKAGGDASAQLAALKGLSGWDRGSFIEKGGWAIMPDQAKTTNKAAKLCADQLAQLDTLAAGTAAAAQ